MAATTKSSHFHAESAAPSGRKGLQQPHVRPRPITDVERAAIEPFLEKVHYSPRYTSPSPSYVPFLSFYISYLCCRYSDDYFEYRLINPLHDLMLDTLCYRKMHLK